MRSFRSKPVGWRYESVRHSLAAKGVKTHVPYMSSKQDDRLRSLEEKVRKQVVEEAKLARELDARGQVIPESGIDNNTINDRVSDRMRAVKLAESSREKSDGGRVSLRTAAAMARAASVTGAVTQQQVTTNLPLNQAVSQVRSGLIAGQIVVGRKTIPIERLLAPDDQTLTSAEKDLLRSEVASKAVDLRNAGRAESELPGFARNIIRGEPIGTAAPSSLAAKAADFLKMKSGYGLTAEQKEIRANEKVEKALSEGALKFEAKAYGRELEIGALDAASKAPAALLSAPIVGFEAMGFGDKGLMPSYDKDIKTYPSLGKIIDEADASPFFQMNAVIGREEEGSFGFMSNAPEAVLGSLRPSTPEPSGVNPEYNPTEPLNFTESWSKLASIGGEKKGAAAAKVVKNEVDSIYKAKEKIAKADLKPFERGTKAFQLGDREGVSKAVAELETQEQMLRDRHTLVQATRNKMLTVENQDALFKDDSSFMGDDGGSKLADETQKVAEVKADLLKSANEVADRKFILKGRLDRMATRVAPETSVPNKVQVVKEGGRSKLDQFREMKFFDDVTGG